MNKFGIIFGIFTGFAGAITLGRYIAAKKAARELREYEELDAGIFTEEES